MPSTTQPTLVLVRDLLFASKITTTARAGGVEVKILRDPAALNDAAGRRLFVDLDQPGTIQTAAQWKKRTGGQVIGFVAHVHADTIRAAHDAGLDQVLSRGAFAQALGQLLSDASSSSS